MIPIFPLPNVVLFPNVFLPLHIFEDRYRAMVRDALAGDRIIGMVLLRGGSGASDDPHPPVYDLGCTGLITHSEPLEGGRFNIVLRGVERFRILDEDHTRPYRQAHIEPVPDPELDTVELSHRRPRLERLVDQRLKAAGSEIRVASQMPDGDLVNALSQYLEFDPVEKQALLERNGVVERSRSLEELLEMDALTDGRGFSATVQ